jgi:signal transduction histidine kinase
MDLTQLLREQAEAATAAAQEKGIALEVALSAPLPGVMADPRAVGRAVAQLLDNAVKFTPPGGCVTLAAALEPGAWADRRPPPARGGRRAPRDAVRVSVADTGMGIPASEQARIFDRFYQVDGSTTRAFGGTGLGLALVKRIVEAHGSRVTVESVVDAGSTFAFTLPAA